MARKFYHISELIKEIPNLEPFMKEYINKGSLPAVYEMLDEWAFKNGLKFCNIFITPLLEIIFIFEDHFNINDFIISIRFGVYISNNKHLEDFCFMSDEAKFEVFKAFWKEEEKRIKT